MPEAETETDECAGCERIFAVNDLHYDVEDASPLCDECYEDCPVVDDDEDDVWEGFADYVNARADDEDC